MVKTFKILETTCKGKYWSKDNTKIGKERGSSYRKTKRSQDKRHTQTHGGINHSTINISSYEWLVDFSQLVFKI